MPDNYFQRLRNSDSEDAGRRATPPPCNGRQGRESALKSRQAAELSGWGRVGRVWERLGAGAAVGGAQGRGAGECVRACVQAAGGG